MPLVEVRPVTQSTWPDLVRFFEAKGSPHFCWCAPYRTANDPDRTNETKKALLRRLVDAGTPIGVLAYAGTEPIGWCSVAPRETYVRLESSRTMARTTPPETPTWTVLCFFVARPRRNQGATLALLRGAIRYAREQGARVVEGYPFDTAGITATHRGHSSIFAACGFKQEGQRWERKVRG